MRLARVAVDGTVHRGEVIDSQVETDEGMFALSEIDLLAPCEPTKIIAAGKNYVDHVKEMNEGEANMPDFPFLFLKPPSSVVAPNDPITYPDISDHVDHEAELAAVIGTRCKDVSEDEALEYVEGYTCLNDVSARDWGDREHQWFRTKGMDDFCPIGPWLQTDLGENLYVEARVNGEIRQSSNTKHLYYSVEELIAEASQVMTLEPGDVIATGTPSGVGPIERGDTVEIEVETVGVLKNEVA